ncbi:uncharacterized protein LOC128239116 [Mya arenaria]|nr:uncharacterized protein LOC128239116 [Mya arenaria]
MMPSYKYTSHQSTDLELGPLRHVDADEQFLRNLSVYTTVRSEDFRRDASKRRAGHQSITELLSGWPRVKREQELPEEEEKVDTQPEQLELRDYELGVKGLELDRRIAPGFRYTVRYIDTSEYLFEGEARRLESIGLGYARRLTFQGDRLNFNDCFFWTDSNPNGFAFTIEAVREGDAYRVVDADGQEVGHVEVHKVDFPQIELGTKIEDNSSVVKNVRVRFACSVKHTHFSDHSLINVNTQDFEIVEGIAELVKGRGQKEAVVRCVRDVHFKSLGRCTLHRDT